MRFINIYLGNYNKYYDYYVKLNIYILMCNKKVASDISKKVLDRYLPLSVPAVDKDFNKLQSINILNLKTFNFVLFTR